MAHDSELEAFRAFARTMPDGCVLLVDTYDVKSGVANAITVAKEMEERGHRLAGIRIDSGDLAWLSQRARYQLDRAGLGYVQIVASNDLDEYTIQSLHGQGACIDSWGVGTHLVTAYDQPALAAVYKLCAVRPAGVSSWRPVMKLSEQLLKNTLPGPLAVRRYRDKEGIYAGDMIYLLTHPPTEDLIIDPIDELRRKALPPGSFYKLLEPLSKAGETLWKRNSVLQIQAVTRENLEQLDDSSKRLLKPHNYPVGLQRELFELRNNLRRDYRGLDEEE
jgi:nicotinate phosphoribosyltransferase